MLKFRNVLSRWDRRELSMMEAGELLGMVRMEILRGEVSRGHFIDDEQLTRLANTAQRLVAALRLDRKGEPAQPRLAEYLARKNAAPEAAP
jgi:hypothetical protein